MSQPDEQSPVPASPEPAAYPARVDELLARVPDPLSEEERAFYQSLIDDEDAQQLGVDVESTSVLDACLDACRTALPLILEARLPGYGPLRARYLLDTARALALEAGALDATVVRAAGAGARRDQKLRGSRAIRRQGLRALRNLSGRSAEQRARLKKLSEAAERVDTRARSLEVIAGELEALSAKVPLRVAADAGLTPELITALRAQARGVLSSRERAADMRKSIRSLHEGMNVLEGRVLHELRALAAAARDARRDDATVPTLRIPILQSRRRRKPAEAPAAPA